MPFAAGGTLVLSYTNGTERWELRIPLAEFDPATFLYTGAGLKAPSESGVAETFSAFGSYWAPYFDASWQITIEAVFWTTGGMGQRLGTLPTPASSMTGTSAAPSSTAPTIQRGFTFQLDNAERHVLRLFGIATDTMGARRAVSATGGGFDARDQALVGYLAGPATGLVAWDGQIFPPTAFVYQRYRLRPFELPGPAGPAGPPGTGLPDGACGDLLYNDGTGWQLLDAGLYGDVLTVQRLSSCLTPAWRSPCCEVAGQGVTGRSAMQGGAWLIATVQAMQGGALLDAGAALQDCAASTCGAAQLMTAKLIEQYELVRGLLVWMLSVPFRVRLGLGGTTVLARLFQALLDFLNRTEAPAWVIRVVEKLRLLRTLPVTSLLTHMEVLPSNAQQILARLLRPCLACSGGTVAITSQTLSCWEAAIEADSADFTDWQRHTMVYALQFSPLSTYSASGDSGAGGPPALCFVNAMQGGAQLTTLVDAGAQQGGSRLLFNANNAQQGGAVLA